MGLITLLILPVFIVCTVRAGVLTNSIKNDEEYDNGMHPDLPANPKTKEFIREAETSFWLESGAIFVKDKVEKELNEKVAKNVIFFIGDGMSLTTLAATRVILGGEEKSISFEKFPYTGMAKTYCLDRKVPDSASTATAYLTGVKANYGTIGVTGEVRRKDCQGTIDPSKQTHSIAKWAIDSGKSAGLVTTTRVTHASPAGIYAHVGDRKWEDDSEVPKGCPADIDIAHQLVHGDVGSKLKVILGGGRRNFRDVKVKDEDGKKGTRSDDRDLIKEWLDDGENREYVYNREGLLKVDANSTDSLLGLFQSTHMLYHLETVENQVEHEKPTLEEMTIKAIEVLQKNDKGFFLFVEGGKIDLAHHSVYARIALDETAELSKAVEAALNMTNPEETLIVVSSDHSHTMTYSGYPDRFNEILGHAGISEEDNIPYMTLSYANGVGFEQYLDVATNKRVVPKYFGDESIKMRYPSTLPIDSETHGGEDVAVFASGPWAHLFTGTYEQNVLPHLMAYASCVGNGHKACD